MERATWRRRGKPLPIGSGAGRAFTPARCAGWNATCRSCSTSSSFPSTFGRSCEPPMPSNAASSKCDDELGPWSSSSMCRAWTESSMPSFSVSTTNGKPAPSDFLHKQLDVTLWLIPLAKVFTFNVQWKLMAEASRWEFDWDDANLRHLARHRISRLEFEQA